MPHHRVLAVAVALLALTATATASAAEPEARASRVGVVVSTRVNVTVDEADALADKLGAALRKQLIVDPIAGPEVTRRLAELKMPEDCVAQPDCVSEVARRLDADELLFLVVVRVGTTVQIDSTWVQVASGRAVSRDAIIIQGDDPPEPVLAGAAQMLLPAAPRREPVAAGGGGARGKHMTRGAWIAAGIGAAALIGGGVFGVAAVQDSNELEHDMCDVSAEPPCSPARVDALETKMLVADSLFAVAAVAGGTALWLYLRSDSGGGGEPTAGPAAPPAVSAIVTPDVLGVSFSGRF